MTDTGNNTNRLFYILTVVIVIAGAVFWSYDLESDPPMYFANIEQSLYTDPANLVYHARNAELYDDTAPFDDDRWIVFENSLVSQTAKSVFSILDPSIKSSNFVGVFLSLGALVLFLLGLMKKYNGIILFLFALLYLINITLFTHGRLAYLENGLLFITAAIFFVYSWWGERTVGIIIVSVFASMAMLMGKLFGLLLFPALIATIFFTIENSRLKKILISSTSFVITALAVSYLLYGTNFSAAFGYIGEQSYGLRGYPEGLSTPWDFVMHLVSYGHKNRLFLRNFDLSLMLLAGGFLLFILTSVNNKLKKLEPSVLFSLFWIGFVIFGLMVFDNSPIRYAIFLIPAIFIFMLTASDSLPNKTSDKSTKTNTVGMIVFGLILWHSLFQIVTFLFYKTDAPFHPLTWGLLPVVAVVLYLLKSLVEKKMLYFSRNIIVSLLAVIVLFSIGFNTYQFYDTRFNHRTYNQLEASNDLGRILSEDAVVAGPYGPALTMNNNLKSFIHMFGVSSVDSSLFKDYPITHLALDHSNFELARKQYPALSKIQPVASYWICDHEVFIFNISKVFGNAQAAQYQLSDYERAALFYNSGQYDSSSVYISSFIRKHRDSKAAMNLSGNMLFAAKKYSSSIAILQRLAETYPTDFSLYLNCGWKMQILALGGGSSDHLSQAEQYFLKAVEINPYRADYATRIWQQTLSRSRSGN